LTRRDDHSCGDALVDPGEHLASTLGLRVTDCHTGAARVGHERPPGGAVGARELLNDFEGADDVEAGAPVLLWYQDPEQACLGQRVVDRPRDRRPGFDSVCFGVDDLGYFTGTSEILSSTSTLLIGRGNRRGECHPRIPS